MGTKRYNKKGVRKTRNLKNKYKKTKKLRQKGGFICKQPERIKIQSSWSNKTEDLRVNTKNYEKYLEECEIYSKCYFTNINNLNLITKILTILNENIGNVPMEFTYKKIPNTETTKFSDYDNIKRSLNNNQINENVSLNTSKFLDIYLTKLYLEYYASYYLTDCKTNNNCDACGVPLTNNFTLDDLNSTFLDKESQEFITNNGHKIVKNKIITFLINLDKNFLLQSILEILSTTLSNVYQDRKLIKNTVITMLNNQANILEHFGGNVNIMAATLVIEYILKIFVLNFAKYIEDYEKKETLPTNSIYILQLVYKLLYSIVYSPNNSYRIKHFIENTEIKGYKLKNFILGTTPYYEMKSLPVFSIVYKINVINCIVKTFLKNDKSRFKILCSEIEAYLTEGTSFKNLLDQNFILAGCKTEIVTNLPSWDVYNLAWSYMFP